MKLKKGTLLFLLLTCLAYTTLAQTNYELQGSDVTIENGIITGCKDAFSNTNIIIPEKIGDITITGIGDEAFKNKSLVTVVFAVASEVTTIGASAFQDNLIVTLTLPPLLTTIGESAFRRNEDTGDNKITELTLPATLTTIGGYAFHKNLITGLSLPATLTTIGGYAFFKNKITGLSLPASLTIIGQGAFFQNEITTLSLPEGLTIIGASAFQNNQITELTLPTTLGSIGVHAFSGNTELKGIILPEHAIGYNCIYKDSNNQEYSPGETFTNFEHSIEMIPHHILKADDVTVVDGIITACACKFENKRIIIPNQIGDITITGIGDEAFKGQSLVTVEFVLGSEVTTIGASAFQSNQIATLTLPTTLTSIGADAFSGNTGLTITLPEHAGGTGVTYKDSNDQVYQPGATFTNFERSLVMLYTLQEGDVTVDEQGVITECKCTFDSKRIIIPEKIGETTITGIGSNISAGVFQDKNLVSVAFASNSKVTTIGDNTFSNNQITKLTLPTTLTTIGSATFYKNSITTLSLPPSLMTISWSAFSENQITKLTLPENLTTIKNWAFSDNLIVTLTLPPSLKIIGEGAFQKNSLTSVTFDDDPNKSRIQSIGSNAFGGNTGTGTGTDTGLAGITLPNHAGGEVTYEDIDDENNPNQVYNPGEVFKNFDRSLDAVIPAHILTVDDVDVDGEGIITKCHCTFVSNEIIIPVKIDGKTITGIGPNAFKEKSLVAVAFAEGSQITSIGNYAFSSNEIATLTLPTTLTTIGKSAFSSNEIATLTLPTTLTTIGESAFSFNNITELTLPTALTTIERGAFSYNQITELTFPDDSQLAIIGSSAFDNNKITTLTFPENSQLASIGSSAFDNNPPLESFTLPMATKEGFRTYWQDNNSVDLETNLTILKADFAKSFELVSIEQFTLTVEVNNEEGGSIEPSDDRFVMDKADAPSTQELTATPADGWRFDKWVITGEEENNDNPTDVTVDVNKTVTAHFVQQVTLTLTIEETGASNVVSGLSAGENKIDKGADFKLKAMPASGQRFVSWTIDGKTITNEEYTLPATTTETNISIKVIFEAISQQVTLTLAIEGKGSINPLVKPNSVDPDNEMKGMYDINTEIELTAKPNDGWKFDKWEISDEEDKTDETTTITLDKNKSVTAHFVKEEEEEEAITSILTEVVNSTPYPNPVTSQITLKAKDGDLIQLFSQKGKQQYSAQHTGNEVHTIDVSTMPVGVYLVRITDAEGNTTTKRIVKK